MSTSTPRNDTTTAPDGRRGRRGIRARRGAGPDRPHRRRPGPGRAATRRPAAAGDPRPRRHAPGTGFPGVALSVRKPGQRTWTGAAGKADLEAAAAMRAGDRFRAGSIMKPFVAAATLQLAEEGRFGLDDPLPAVLPGTCCALPGGGPDHGADAARPHERASPSTPTRVLRPRGRRPPAAAVDGRRAPRPRGGEAAHRGARRALRLRQHQLQPARPDPRAGDPQAVAGRRPRAGHRAAPPEHTSLPQPGAVPRRTRHRARLPGHRRPAPRPHRRRRLDGRRRGRARPAHHDRRPLAVPARAARRPALPAAARRSPRCAPSCRRRTITAGSATGSAWSATSCPAASRWWATWARPPATAPACSTCPRQDIDLAMVTTSPDDPMPVLEPALKLLVAEAS